MPRATQYNYDPSTGQWTQSTTDSGTNSGSNGGSNGGTQSTTATQGTQSNLTASTGDRNSATGSTEKEYNQIELNTLEGQLAYIVTQETIKLTAGDTVNIQGIGKYLSGNYYVKSVNRSISSDGYSNTAVLIRTDFGKSLKSEAPTVEQKDESSVPQAVEEVSVQAAPAASVTPSRTYTVVRGDCLWNIAKQFYGDGSQYMKIANANGISNPNLIYAGQTLTIP